MGPFSPRLGDTARAVAVPQHHLRSAHPEGAASDGQPADARLTSGLAKEICERTGGAAVLDGSIAEVGSQYVGLRAKAARQDVLDEEQVQAAGKKMSLNALSQIASKFRNPGGEQLATVESTLLRSPRLPRLRSRPLKPMARP
jgi:hypothetical protein